MKTHTSGFKEEIKLLGRQQAVKITYTLDEEIKVLDNEDVNSITPNYTGNLLKSVMKGLEIDSNIDIPIGTILKFEYGILVGEEYEYLNYGNYVVKSSKKQEDTLSYKITCYDKILYSMKDYDKLSITYPCTIKEYLTALCTRIGLQFKDSTFANQDRVVSADLFNEQGYTYRDVLDQIAETTGGTICLTLDDKLEVRYINNTNDTIDEEYINDTNVNFGEKYGPINSIVLARAGESDKIYIKDQDSVVANGLCELMISENQFMNYNDRVDYLEELSEKLFGVQYYINDYVSTGIMYYDLLDMYNVQIGDNVYNCLMLNDEQNITQGLEENIYTDRLDQSETDYTKADKTDRRINKTYIIADKINQEIVEVISRQDEQSNKITNITTDIDGIHTTIENNQKDVEDKIFKLEQTIEGTTQILTNKGGDNIFYYAKEFWTDGTENGIAKLNEYTDTEIQKISVSGNGYKINKGTSEQKVNVKNDMYTISFTYKKLISLAVGYVLINNERIDLSSTQWKEEVLTLNIDTNNVDFKIISDTDNAFEVYDLMGTIGEEKQIWTQNPNETRTDTVTIGKGIEVKSSSKNTYARFDADGNRIFNNSTNQVVTALTDKGVETNEIDSQLGKIGGILIQKMSGQTWISSLL